MTLCYFYCSSLIPLPLWNVSKNNEAFIKLEANSVQVTNLSGDHISKKAPTEADPCSPIKVCCRRRFCLARLLHSAFMHGGHMDCIFIGCHSCTLAGLSSLYLLEPVSPFHPLAWKTSDTKIDRKTTGLELALF